MNLFIRLDFKGFLNGLEACGDGLGEVFGWIFEGTLTEQIYA